jgi:hypothetical protein
MRGWPAMAGILIASLAASFATAGVSDVEPSPELKLRLRWVDVGKPDKAAFAVAARELADIFGDVQIEIEWRRGRAGEIGTEADVNVIVLDSSPAFPGRVMGVAHHSDPLPHYVHVFVGHIRETLGLDPRANAVLRPSERALLGRAIGRVIAHEIIHVYAPEHSHEVAGLMRPSLDARFLKQEHVHLEEASVAAVVSGLSGGSTGTAVLAPAQ